MPCARGDGDHADHFPDAGIHSFNGDAVIFVVAA